MPLNLAEKNQEHIIKKVAGKQDIRHYLGTLGFVSGAKVNVLTEYGDCLVVLVKGSKIALNSSYAKRIII